MHGTWPLGTEQNQLMCHIRLNWVQLNAKKKKWCNGLLGQRLTKVTSTLGWVNGLKFLRHFHAWFFKFTQNVLQIEN